MKNQLKPIAKFSLKKELSRSELKQITGGSSTIQTYCSDGWNSAGSAFNGECLPGYCNGIHGTFLYCA